jgi:hypothetical protein
MPAKIVLVSGPGSGREMWIESPVLRIGGDAGCGLRLDGATSHLATVEYRPGGYVIHDRSKRGLTIEGSRVAPGRSASWPSGRLVLLDSGHALMLEASADPAPSRRPAEVARRPAAEKIDRLLGTGGPHRRIRTIAAAIMATALPAMFLLPSPHPAPRTEPVIVADLLAATRVLGRGAQATYRTRVGRELQRARIAELRGEPDTAQAVYRQVRDALLIARGPGRDFADHWSAETFAFVVARLR